MTAGRERSWSREHDRLGRGAAAAGDATGWFESLWAAGARDEIDLPWERDDAYPPLVARLSGSDGGESDGAGRTAVVVGAGLGADAELLSRHGFRTTAFDVSPSAVELARARRPGSAVEHRVADLLDLPPEMRGAFDLVVEIFTVQALPRRTRDAAGAGVRALLAPGGEALVVQFVLGDGDPDDGPPWLLDRAEIEGLAGDDVELAEVRTERHPLRPGVGPDIWVAVLRRRGGSRP